MMCQIFCPQVVLPGFSKLKDPVVVGRRSDLHLDLDLPLGMVFEVGWTVPIYNPREIWILIRIQIRSWN